MLDYRTLKVLALLSANGHMQTLTFVKRLWINKTQHFEGVPKDAWDFHIGGYKVCDKWLKDRKGRELSYDDQQHYQNIVAALASTIKLMAKIDKAIDDNGGWPLA